MLSATADEMKLKFDSDRALVSGSSMVSIVESEPFKTIDVFPTVSISMEIYEPDHPDSLASVIYKSNQTKFITTYEVLHKHTSCTWPPSAESERKIYLHIFKMYYYEISNYILNTPITEDGTSLKTIYGGINSISDF